MTSTLLLRLAGPMQSWGTQSRFRDRDTGREPSKSGIVGLLCAAQGRSRSTPVADLAALRMGVRVDREGVLKVDYQTAGGSHRLGDVYGVARAENAGIETVVSARAYLADASFLVGLEASTPEQEILLARLDAALAAPAWTLYLGRKSYVPSVPIRLPDIPPAGPGLVRLTLQQALEAYPWSDVPEEVNRIRFVLETREGDQNAEVRNDWPLSFESTRRQFVNRYVLTEFHSRPASAPAVAEA